MVRLLKSLFVINQHVRFFTKFPESRMQLTSVLSNESLQHIQPNQHHIQGDALAITSKKSDNLTGNRKKKFESNKYQFASPGESTATIDEAGDLVYVKMQHKDPRIMQIMAEVKNNMKKRTKILLEGKRLIREALQRGCHMEYLLFSQLSDVEDLKAYLPKVGKLYKMPYREIQSWSDLTTTPGIMGVFHIPDMNTYTPKDPLPLTIICDNIREPNNLGAILRIASAVGCEKVILTKGCVNLWDSKVLRSACGAHFHTNVCKDVQWNEVSTILPENANVFLADNNILTSSGHEQNSAKEMLQAIPILPYFSVEFNRFTKLVLVIGGETEGLSLESYKLAKGCNGARLNVPLSNNVDSLNSGTALGIIAFEIKRQLYKKG